MRDEFVSRCRALLQHVQFKNYEFITYESTYDGFMLHARYIEPCVYTGQPAVQLTRRWILKPTMTDSEIVSTAFKCCLTSMEHRTRETFKYKGARIFGPHFDIEDLVSLCLDNKREDAGGRVPVQPKEQL